MERITQKDLQNLCDRINEETGNKLNPYNHSIPGSGCKPNANVYHLDWAYGGVKLCQMSPKKGYTGSSDVTHGYDTKRELYNKMGAILTGLSMKV